MTNWAGTMTQRGTFGILAVCIALTMLSSCGRNRTVTTTGEGSYLDRDNVGNPVDNNQITGNHISRAQLDSSHLPSFPNELTALALCSATDTQR